jgi:hypothetical protein
VWLFLHDFKVKNYKISLFVMWWIDNQNFAVVKGLTQGVFGASGKEFRTGQFLR